MAEPPARFKVLVLNQISASGLKRLPAERYTRGKDIAAARRGAGALGRHARHGHPGQRAGDRPRRRRHQQHPGGGDERARRAGVQRAGRQCQCGEGTGAGRHADGGAQPRAGAALRRRARPGHGRPGQAVEDGKKDFAGFELAGQTLGIVGLGKIGCLVADAAIKLGMNVLGYDPDITVDAAWSLPSQVKKAASVAEVLKNADFVTLHVPLVDATRDLVNADNLGLMRPGAVLLNFSREGVVNDAAVLAALDSEAARLLRLRLSQRGAARPPERDRAAAPGRLHARGRGQLRGDGGATSCATTSSTATWSTR